MNRSTAATIGSGSRTQITSGVVATGMNLAVGMALASERTYSSSSESSEL